MLLEQKVVLQGAMALDVVVLCAEEEVRDVIAYWLTSLPARAFVADDGYDANRLLRDVSCRLLVTDRVLPPWPGLDTFMELRQRNPNLRIAFVDVRNNVDDRILAKVTGATDVLLRPLRRQAMIDSLMRAEPVS